MYFLLLYFIVKRIPHTDGLVKKANEVGFDKGTCFEFDGVLSALSVR